ncbi:MAG TPA: FAD-dependent oxidoreductase [Rhodocyclaceae bacterium]|nr:FAD-dependent oxidoreductase [Rhodocyclaceae bacterium]
MRHLIIGNGPAGVIAAETLRRLDPAADVTMVGDEVEPPYSRMAIPYLLAGNIGEQGTHLRKEAGHFERLNIRLVRGRAEKLDSSARTVTLADGEVLPYDRLLIASGSHALRPPGMDLPGVQACWTLADARAIIAKATPGARVLQIGAGFIGCIILEALVARGVKLTVVEMGDRMVPRMMTEGAGNMIRRWVEGRGVTVHVNCRVASLAAQDGALAAKLDSGATVPADLVICAAGVAPNVAFLAGSGVDVGRGVRVDAAMQTNVPGIYAAGDVAEAADFHSGEPAVNAIQPNAADQARIAAGNMAGEEARTQGSLAINVLDTLGLISTSFGQWWAGEGVELVDEERFRYLSLQFQDDVLIGATAVGLTDHVGALRGLIQGRVRLGAWKTRLQADPTQFMAAYLGCAQKAA